MIYKVSSTKDQKIEQYYQKSIKDFGKFFDIDYKIYRPVICFLSDRKTIDKFSKRKTESWLVGWVKDNLIFLLSPENYKTESNHEYSDLYFENLLRHEVVHYYTRLIVAKNAGIPAWLSEGIAIFLSGQLIEKIKPKKYLNFIDYFDHGGENLYSESGFAVEFLIKKYGQENFFELLKGLTSDLTKESFKKLFKEIYGFDLAYKNFKIL